ncbi:MAG: NADPH-dependent assimilatory sulfite reductase hemoprotein subunit [Candidatus Methylacidiphilales bacterium]|nr:NADPH-dependent assimilatory sulfite reductase hemoprotein subunit [Candidatus Methylacidiphilales bacterium]
MSNASVETIKDQSRSLRGTIVQTLQSEATHFSDEEYQLLKFHGTYQQDDRDLRNPRKAQGLDKAWSFMVRSKIPGGAINAEQYLMHDRMADDLGNGTIRITNRQGFQMHGVLKGSLKDCIARIVRAKLTTWGACGDVVRNTMAAAAPFKTPVYDDVQQLGRDLSETFMPASTAFSEIWLDGQKLELNQEDKAEPIYGKHYLPRKFKIGIAVPPVNDADVFTQDIGYIAHVVDGRVTGYNLTVGGGFGMSHGQTQTYPVLGKPLFYVAKEHAVAAAIAIVTVQRDNGNREDRKQARLKYLIEKRGLDWFKAEVLARLPGIPTEPFKPYTFTTVGDFLGWHEQGDGKWFVGIWVEQGRIKDTDQIQYRSAFREIAQTYHLPVRLTPNANLLFHDIAPDQKAGVDAILRKFHIPVPDTLTEARKTSHACVSLPTCGLGLAESERVLGGIMDKIDAILRELGLEKEPILIRMTGCPNGCGRPYNADFGFVGRAPKKYAFYLGGSSRGDRLAGLEAKSITEDQIPEILRTHLKDYKDGRKKGESFTDYLGRTHTLGAAPHPDQFHVEFAERAAKAVSAAPLET